MTTAIHQLLDKALFDCPGLRFDKARANAIETVLTALRDAGMLVEKGCSPDGTPEANLIEVIAWRPIDEGAKDGKTILAWSHEFGPETVRYGSASHRWPWVCGDEPAYAEDAFTHYARALGPRVSP